VRHGIAFASAVGIAVVVASPPARAEITAVVIDKVEPFAEGMAERLAGADPRPSLEHLYGTPTRCVEAVSAAAQALVKDRPLLPKDAERYIAAARAETAF
jgi:hypothetical protein